MTSDARKHAAGLLPNREITEQALKETGRGFMG